MILVTVGSQLPFDRLIQLVDEIAPELSEPVFAQTGKGTYTPRAMRSAAMIAPSEFDGIMAEATLIVSHAGIGTVLTAQQRHKPILLFPRRVEYGEHRNDHQLATVGGLRERPGIYVAETGPELHTLLRERKQMVPAAATAQHPARDQLLSSLSDHFATVLENRRRRISARLFSNR